MIALERSINTEVIVGQRAGEADPEEALKPGRSGDHWRRPGDQTWRILGSFGAHLDPAL